MVSSPSRRSALLLSALLVGVFAARGSAERLPARAYTTTDGLAHDRVLCVVQDSRGFLWFCTVDGVSRFDGHRFVSYGRAQGLPEPPVYNLIEARPGVFWAAAHGGLARFDATDSSRPPGSSLFVPHPLPLKSAPHPMLALLRDRHGVLWSGGEAGLFTIDDATDDGAVRIAPAASGGFDWGLVGRVRTLLEDSEGSLWVAGEKGVARRTPDGRVVGYGIQVGGRLLKARGLLEVEPGTLWVGTGDTLIELRAEPARAARGVDAHAIEQARPCASRRDRPRPSVCERGSAIGRGGFLIRSLYRAPDGTIWVGAVNGLSSFDGTRFRTFGQANGLSNETINAITVDRAGSLWLGTDLGGAIRIPPTGMTTYTIADGLLASDIGQIMQDADGVLYVMTLARGIVHRFDGRAFHPVDLRLGPSSVPGRTHGSAPQPPGAKPAWWVKREARPLSNEPFDENQRRIFTIFPHSSGDLWLGEHAPEHDTLLRWRHDTAAVQRFAESDGPSFDITTTFDSTLVFAEDPRRNTWIGIVDGGVERFGGESFEWVRDGAGQLLGGAKDVSVDASGRVWIATDQGVWRVEDPGAAPPRASLVVSESVLGQIKCITFDAQGRLYVGTPNGIEQVDPAAGRVVRRYTRADGLAHNEVLAAFRDRSGALWFGSYEGASRFVPPADRPEPPPPVFVSGVVVAGRQLPVAELGATAVGRFELAPDERQIQIDFSGLSFGVGDPIRFQYRLVGADRNWSAPAETRSVSYAQLTRGEYRFEVRAVGASGVVSAAPAVVSFRVLAPVWARWWFIAAAVGAIAVGAHLAYRMRTARLVEVERIRTRIAADLHDDIGANLSRIAMMSDVALTQLASPGAGTGQLLASVASISRESVDAMSDIVWAVDPSRDRFKDLAQRMRRVASDVLSARDITVAFRSADPEVDWPLGADVRREVLLIFKEAVNNVARHSTAREATIDVAVGRGLLILTVADNGRGFDVGVPSDGNGLVSMRRRADRLGGQLTLKSGPGRGTVLELRIPLR